MSKLIHGEMYRLFHKKSIYIYFIALALGYGFLAFVRSGGFTETSVVSDALNFFSFFPALVGGILFSAIYTDDLQSKNLITLVGFGIHKTTIVVAKLIMMAIFSTVIYAVAPLIHMGVYAMLGQAVTMSTVGMIYAVSLKYLLTTLGFAALSAIVVYGLQRSTFAIVLYILLAFNVVSGLVGMFLNMFAPSLTAYLMSGITDRVFTDTIAGTIPATGGLEYIVYIAVAVTLSILAFHKKEMEF